MLNVVCAGFGFVALAMLLRVLKTPLIRWWQIGGMWGFKRTLEQAEMNHRFAMRWCLVGGVTLSLVGLGGALFNAVSG